VRSQFGKCLLTISMLWITSGRPAEGDTLNGGTATNWNANYLYSLPSYMPGLYYWNNNSGDGNQSNIGWCLVGGAQCGMQNAPGYMPYYSNGVVSDPGNMYFTSSGNPISMRVQLTLTDQRGGRNGIDLFGYYRTDSAGQAILDPTVIFTSNDAIGNTYTAPALTFAAGENYGFFIENVQGLGTAFVTYYIYYMNSAMNTATGSMPAGNAQHFAVFSSGTTYYVGMVDTSACQGTFQPESSPCMQSAQFDFNDLIIELDTTSGLRPNVTAVAPEPGSAALLAGGLLGIGTVLRLRRKSSPLSR
jgi:hypothetical protein